MKIALLTDGIYPDFVGGMQKHSAYLAKYLVKHGVEVELYLRDVEHGDLRNIDLFTAQELERIHFHYVPYPSSRYFPGHYIWQSYQYSSRIFEMLKNNLDVDFIYAQGFSGWKMLREKRRGLKSVPIGVHFHGFDMFQKAPSFKAKMQQWMFRPLVVSVLQLADAVFSLGGRLDKIIESVGVSCEKLFHSPNGVEASWLATTTRIPNVPRRFLFVGRYARLKGIEELSIVLRKMAAENMCFEFNFVGPIPEKLQVIAPYITYWGMIKDTSKLQEIMRQCDCLVCPSYAEGAPTVIMESMASGLAVIATDVGAVASMVSAENGWLIKPGDEEALDDALRQALFLPDERLLAMKNVSLKLAQESFLWDVVAEKTLSQIREIIYKHE